MRGVPVLCSDIPPLREVAGDCAVFFDALGPGSMARAIEALLARRRRARAPARGRPRPRRQLLLARDRRGDAAELRASAGPWSARAQPALTGVADTLDDRTHSRHARIAEGGVDRERRGDDELPELAQPDRQRTHALADDDRVADAVVHRRWWTCVRRRSSRQRGARRARRERTAPRTPPAGRAGTTRHPPRRRTAPRRTAPPRRRRRATRPCMRRRRGRPPAPSRSRDRPCLR